MNSGIVVNVVICFAVSVNWITRSMNELSLNVFLWGLKPFLMYIEVTR